MNKWEYKIIALPIDLGLMGGQFYNGTELSQHLNWLGDLGWELVDVSIITANGYSKQVVATLKRSVSAPPPS